MKHDRNLKGQYDVDIEEVASYKMFEKLNYCQILKSGMFYKLSMRRFIRTTMLVLDSIHGKRLSTVKAIMINKYVNIIHV